MTRIFCVFLNLTLFFSLSGQNKPYPVIKLKYPKTKTVSQVDDYHGTKVSDPYRWLEDDKAPEVEKWVEEENAVTSGYFQKVPFRDKIVSRYQELFNYVKLSSPLKIGNRFLFAKNDGLQNQAVIYIQDGDKGTPKVLLDPNQLSKDGTEAVTLMEYSKSKRYIAYTKSASGSDWSEIRVLDLETKKELPDVIKWVKFSNASWQGDGFYYSRFPEPKGGGEMSDANKFHSIYYHKLGDPQSADVKIFGNDTDPLINHYCSVTEDERFLAVYAAAGTDGFETYFKDLKNPDAKFVKLFSGFENKSTIVDNNDDFFLVHTNIDAPNYKLIQIDPAYPDKKSWATIIPQSKDVLESVTTGGGKLFAIYLQNATNKIIYYDRQGYSPTELKLPELGTATGFSGNKDDSDVYYTFSSFLYPPTIFKFNISTGKSEPYFQTELKFNPKDYVSKQVFFNSKGGKKVSMFIVHKKSLKLDGTNPCLLYGYGGFNISQQPNYSPSRMLLLENGGIFALPNIRGGGEYGEAWHKAGMLEKKQQVFDDFIAAAEYLIARKYTSSAKLGIAGGSNGGLLVGACMVQRPELFAVALPAVGVMDMLRFHKFTIGWAWVPEYGSSDNPEQFAYLYKYSPYHNLKKSTAYPATLVTTGDHDDRVVPAHSFKFAAMLQSCQKGNNPTLIRIEKSAGHGAGKPTSKIIEEQADIWSFFFYNTNTTLKY
jgi:prolyl oligopeptidase